MENIEDNKLGNITYGELGEDNPVIQSDTTLYSESFYYTNLYDEMIYKKFLKSVVSAIRRSKEYKVYVGDLKMNVPAMSIDNVFKNITSDDAELELHHYPFTLYDIVDVVATHNYVNNINFNTFTLVKEIMELHFKNKIGLVPLTTLTHELAHLDSLFISTKQIFGKWEKFMEEYKDGVSAMHRLKIDKIKELTEKDTPTDFRNLF